MPAKLPPLRTDLVISKAEISIPDCRVRIQSLAQIDSSNRSRPYLAFSRFGQPFGSNGFDEDSCRSLSSSPSSSPPRCSFPMSSYTAQSSNLKRKRSLKERHASENVMVAGRLLSLPNPPPLSLSDNIDGSRTCKMSTSDVDKSAPCFPHVLSHRVQDCHGSEAVTPPSEC